MKRSFASAERCLVLCGIALMASVLSSSSEPGLHEIRAGYVSDEIEFRPLVETSRSTPTGTQVTFYFRNGSRRVVALPGYFGSPPRAGVFKPAFIQYEMQVNDTWRELDVMYDGLPEYIQVEPGTDLRLLICLGPFEKLKVAGSTPVRIKLDEIASATFKLEQIPPKK